ncbi:MAG: HAMP domain-containing histidine kinase [Deltaproteobacteria bacterium]|nr:HAMP domain-containing histidine kinase [Deltaproteobacteria bacterium]
MKVSAHHRTWIPLSFVLVALGLSVWLGVAGPAAVRARAAETLQAEQVVIAHQGAARIEAILASVADRLADPAMRRVSGIEAASGPAALRDSLSRVPREGLLAGHVVLLVHDEEGRVLATDEAELGPMAAEFGEHRHENRAGRWESGAGVCPMCLAHLHQISVASPLGGGRYLTANVDAAVVAKRSLESLLAGAGRAAWLTDEVGTELYAAGERPAKVGGADFIRARAPLARPAAGWQVHIAASTSLVGQGVARSAAGLLLGAAGIALLLAIAAALTYRDVRQRHHQELARAAALAHHEKLTTLGALTASIGHEMRNIVTALAVNIDFALQSPSGSAETAEALRDADDAARRLRELAVDLTAYGRRDGSAPASRPLRAPVEEALRMVRPWLKHGPRVQTDFQGDPVVAQVGGQLAQVFLNLVRNAAEAMTGRSGLIRVEVSNTGPTARVLVEDEGPGLPADVLAHLFEPFFTTKAAEVGTGLGLSVCAEIVRRHGGSVAAENRADRVGARFVVELPCVSGAGAPQRDLARLDSSNARSSESARVTRSPPVAPSLSAPLNND